MSSVGPRKSYGVARARARSRLALHGRWPLRARLVMPSLLAPVADAPSERLLDVALQAIAAARSQQPQGLADGLRDRARRAAVRASGSRPPARRSLRARLRGERRHVVPSDLGAWPGEHYRLLAGLIATLSPRTIVEIGTATGASALAMKAALPAGGAIVTFDLVPWRVYPRAVLEEDDFRDGSLEQRCEDLSSPAAWDANAELLRRAEFILVDASHDGVAERGFLRGFDYVGLAAAPIVMFDDIRLWRMLSFWQEIPRPKLDLTSFGHWSGTGLVDYT